MTDSHLSNNTGTDVLAFLEHQNGGVLIEKLQKLLSHVAANVVDRQAKGVVSLKFQFQPIKGSETMINCVSTLEYKHPTMRGNKGEDDISEMPFYIGAGGKLTAQPDTQQDLLQSPQRTGEDK